MTKIHASPKEPPGVADSNTPPSIALMVNTLLCCHGQQGISELGITAKVIHPRQQNLLNLRPFVQLDG